MSETVAASHGSIGIRYHLGGGYCSSSTGGRAKLAVAIRGFFRAIRCKFYAMTSES